MRKSWIGIGAAFALLVGMLPASTAVAADLMVSGSVTLDGVPMANVWVGWYDPIADVYGQKHTGADGTYSLAIGEGHPFILFAGIHRRFFNPASGVSRWVSQGGTRYVGTFAGAGGQDSEYQTLTAFTGALAGRNIVLTHPGAIAVVDSKLAGQRISLERLDRTTLRTRKAGTDGRVEFDGLIPGNYRVSSYRFPAGTLANYVSPTIVVTAGQTTFLNPVLQTTGSVSGIVTSAGKPVAHVTVASFLGHQDGPVAVTDAHGRYTLKNASPGRYDITLEPGGDDSVINNRRVLPTHRVTTVEPGKSTPLDIAVKPSGSITGTIAPTTRAFVSVFVLDGRGALVGSTAAATSTKTSTPFTIHAVVPGAVTVYLAVEGASSKYGSVRTVVHATKNSRIGTLRFDKKTVSLSGKVASRTIDSVQFRASVPELSSGSAKVRAGRFTITKVIPVRGSVGALETEARLARTTTVTPGSGSTPTVKLGAKRPRVSALIIAGNFPLVTGNISVDTSANAFSGDLGTLEVARGRVSGQYLDSGNGTLTMSNYFESSPFLQGSPFYLTIPDRTGPVILVGGQTTQVGDINLVLHR